MTDPRPVFMSYTHDSPEHVDRILELSRRLRVEASTQYSSGSVQFEAESLLAVPLLLHLTQIVKTLRYDAGMRIIGVCPLPTRPTFPGLPSCPGNDPANPVSVVSG